MAEKKFTFSQNQIFWLIMASAPVGITTLPREINEYSEQSGWIFIFLSLALILLAIRILLVLPKRYPGCSMLEILEQIIGKRGARCIFFFLAVLTIVGTGVSVRLLSDGVIVHILFHTPNWIIILVELVLVMYAVTKKEETLARFNELAQPLLLMAVLIICFLVINKADFSYLKPVIARDIDFNQSLIISMYYFLDSWVFLFFLPSMSNFDALKNGVLQGLIFLSLITAFLFILSISLFGPVEINFIEYPTIDMARLVEVPILERMEILYLTSWIVFSFTLNHLTFLAGSVGMKTLFPRSSFLMWVGIIGVVVFITAIYPKNIEQVQAFSRILQFGTIIIIFSLFPLIVLIDTVKKKVKQNGAV
ncbi:GerAB/ArcD/ProY family transporter [Schinkia sp. CFF1]